MAEFEKIESQEGGKWKDFQQKYNLTSKGIVRLLGTNISLLVCILIPMLLIGFIWTDFSMSISTPHLVSDGIVTVLMFVIGEAMMMRVGNDGGKLDADYLSARTDFRSLVDEVNKLGTEHMTVFCDEQIKSELNHAFVSRLRAMRMTAEQWEKVKDIPFKELKKTYGIKKAVRINDTRKLEPIEINEAILLYDSELDAMSRGGVPISGDGYMKKKMHSVEMILSCLFMGFLTVSVAITLTDDFTFARVMYTAFKVIVLLFRMARGYERGAKAYNTVEVAQLQAKSNYLRQYIKFVNEKSYENVTDEYKGLNYQF